MNHLSIGQIVISKSGRDKNRMFIIMDIQGEYVYLVDGQLRKLEKPKKKKTKHIQQTKYVDKTLQYKLIEYQKIQNAEIRKTIQLYQAEK